MKPLVSILMPAYNHEKFIEQAIKSALNQKTSFSFELLIHEDKSNDGTRNIVQDYENKFPNIIKVIYQDTNQGLIKSYRNLLKIASGKYIAILESDDCWTDERKLEKQISFLENNNDFGLVATSCNHINEKDEVTLYRKEETLINTNDWYDELIKSNTIVAVTVCFRKEVFDKYCNINDYTKYDFKTFDYEVWLSIAKNSRCKYLIDNTSSYRVLSTSISNTQNYNKQIEWEKSIATILRYIISIYGKGSYSKKEIDNIITNRFLQRAIKNKKIFSYIFYSHCLKITNIKIFFHKYFPLLYYFQRKIRNLGV